MVCATALVLVLVIEKLQQHHKTGGAAAALAMQSCIITQVRSDASATENPRTVKKCRGEISASGSCVVDDFRKRLHHNYNR
eukprot:scaffold18382_cov155-Skeletonema_dohrnii-CCMP3373.AAC.12